MANILLNKTLQIYDTSAETGSISIQDSIIQDAFSTGKKVGAMLSKVHALNAQNGALEIPEDGGTENLLSYSMHGFHDRCHKSIFHGSVARRIGAVQTTYIWQFIIQYLYRLEHLPPPSLIYGNLDISSVVIGDIAYIPVNEKSGVIGDSMMDFGAVFRGGLDKNADFVKGLEDGYTLPLPHGWIVMAKMLDLGWWLIQIDAQEYKSSTIQPLVDNMLIAFEKLGAGNKNTFNKNTFSYTVDTTALVQKRKK